MMKKTEEVYICSEGRPWRKTDDGFERIKYEDVPSVPSEQEGFRAPGDGVIFKRKPYDEKNGF